MNAIQVLKGERGWSAERADALTWLRSLPTGCVSLVFFSPPYEDARLYAEAKFNLKGQAPSGSCAGTVRRGASCLTPSAEAVLRATPRFSTSGDSSAVTSVIRRSR